MWAKLVPPAAAVGYGQSYSSNDARRSHPMPATPVAPGSVVVVRDEEWLVSSEEPAADGQLLSV